MTRLIPRRTMVRGAGVALALPFLEAMAPLNLRAESGALVRRLATIYVPNGMAMDGWTPATDGRDFAFTPILAPLTPFRRRLRVISGLSTLDLPTVPAYHAAASTKFLTATSPAPTRGTVARAGVSVDQIVAQAVGGETLIPSLEVGLEESALVGACDVQYSCAYQNTICWSASGAPLLMEANPRAVFERLFGDAALTDPGEREQRLRMDHSVLDSVTISLGRITRRIGTGDRAILGEYLESLRSVERKLQATERRSPDLPDHGALNLQATSFVDRATLMLDLMTLAFQADLTRVCTLMVGCEASMLTYPELGISEAHHQLSHHQNDPDKLARLAIINTQHTKLLAYFLDRLQSLGVGGRSLLDDAVVLYGAGMSDSNAHRHDNLPIVVAGSTTIADGTHVRYRDHTPLANLHMTLLDACGVPAEHFGNSTGRLRQNADA